MEVIYFVLSYYKSGIMYHDVIEYMNVNVKLFYIGRAYPFCQEILYEIKFFLKVKFVRILFILEYSLHIFN